MIGIYLTLALLATAAAQSATSTSSAPEVTESTVSRTAFDIDTHIETEFYPQTCNGSAVKITGLSKDGMAIFLGIPFAEPPVGDLRFEHPVPATKETYGEHVNATVPPKSCLQRPGTLSANASGISEDCLKINVIAPECAVGRKRTFDKPLPVLVWIYGGGFYGGSAMQYTSMPLVNHSMQTDKPMILVTLGYRCGIFGFPHGKEMSARGTTNLGLRDQILALEWVRDHIGSFGGDPSAVTVFGESAGAISISLLMLNPKQNLFRAAIMESGAQSTLPIGDSAAIYQKPFDDLVSLANCSAAALNTNASLAPNVSTVDCLKRLSGEDLLAAQTEMMDSTVKNSWGYPFGPGIDGDIIPASPYHMLKNGTFARIPFITGCNKDEGTEFLGASLSQNLTKYGLRYGLDIMYPFPIPDGFLRVIEEKYPLNASLGAPFGSGENLFNDTVSLAWKQATAAFTDLAMESRRRWFLRQANKHGFKKTWTYHFTATNPRDLDYMGSSHEAEKPYVMGRAIKESGYSDAQVALSHTIMDYWINFVYHSDPNGKKCKNPTWKAHTYPKNKNSLLLGVDDVRVIQDDYRDDRIDIFNQPQNAYYVRR